MVDIKSIYKMKLFFVFILFPSLVFGASSEEINKYIGSIDSRFHPDLIRAIAWQESAFDIKLTDGVDWGIMQINLATIDPTKVNIKRMKTDWKYNIDTGVQILEDKYWQAVFIRNLPAKRKKIVYEKYGLYGLTKLEIAILGYNGLRSNHSYLRSVKKIYKKRLWEAQK
jgi:hypothetical protein